MTQSNADPASGVPSSGSLAARIAAALSAAAAASGTPSGLNVRHLRERMDITQREFAGWFGISVGTLRQWERGRRKPTGCALVLLHVIRENPRVVLRAVRKARMRDALAFPPIERQKSYRAPPGYGARCPTSGD